MMVKKIFNSNYSKAWLDYRKSKDYQMTLEALKQYGIKAPYRENIIKASFAAGWNASGITIKEI